MNFATSTMSTMSTLHFRRKVFSLNGALFTVNTRYTAKHPSVHKVTGRVIWGEMLYKAAQARRILYLDTSSEM